MERRKFLVSSLAASALAVTTPGSYAAAAQGAMQGKGREFYQLRRYHLNSGPQRKLCDDFFRDALLPAASSINSGAITSIAGRRESFAMIFSAMRSCPRSGG